MAASDINVRSEDMDEADKILKDPEAIKKIFSKINEEGEEMQDAVKAIRENPVVKRKADAMARKSNLRGQIDALSLKEKKKLKAKAATMMKPMAEKPTSLIPVVTITPSRKIKAINLTREFKTYAKYEGWILETVKEGPLHIFYNPNNKCKNRLASRIMGTDRFIGNELFIFKLDEEGQLVPTNVEEVEKMTAT